MNGKSEKRQKKKKKHSGEIYIRKNIIYKILLQKKNYIPQQVKGELRT